MTIAGDLNPPSEVPKEEEDNGVLALVGGLGLTIVLTVTLWIPLVCAKFAAADFGAGNQSFAEERLDLFSPITPTAPDCVWVLLRSSSRPAERGVESGRANEGFRRQITPVAVAGGSRGRVP